MSLESALPRRGRKTIAILVDYMNFYGWGYEAQLRQELHARCVEYDLNLIVVYGRGIDDPNPWSKSRNAVYDLVQEGVHGVIVVSTSLAMHCGVDGMSRFLARYAGLPMASVGVAIPGVPSILTDNAAGLAAAADHLIEVHGCRRLAFIGGPELNREAQARFESYRATLEKHGIEFDAALVEHGDFVTESGHAAMARLLRRGTRIDGVVSANDAMAFGAVDALRQHGARVPHDLPVVGFDNLNLSPLANPPLTSVAQPYASIADVALKSLLAQMDGVAVPECTSLSPELVVRRSCGCRWRALAPSNAARAGAKRSALEHVRVDGESIAAALEASLRDGESRQPLDVRPLIAAVERALAGEPRRFLEVVEKVLEGMASDRAHCRALLHAVTWLRDELSGFDAPGLEPVWYEAMSLIALASTSAQVQHERWLGHEYFKLLAACEHLSATFDFESLQRVLLEALVSVGMPTAFLSRFADGSSEELVPCVSLVDGVSVPGRSEPFKRRLLPAGAFPDERRHTSLAFPLAFEGRCHGVAVFEYSPGVKGYTVICDQVGLALNTVELHRELVEKTMQHERSVQERAATAKRMQSLSVLAGGVAHDLNNALGPLVALSDVMLQELVTFDSSGASLAELRSDIQSIKSGALRAASTIKDLLTLGRQGRVTKKALDLNIALTSCLGGEFLRFLRERSRARISVDLCSEPLVIHASEAHLARAVTNLVRNAVEAVNQDGDIVVRTHGVVLREATTRYETLDAGSYAVVSVTDTGSGIAAEEMGRLFEPYFSKKKLRDDSGTGLGLAIVHGVVKEHEGFIDVSSAPGRGTTFSLYFPRLSHADLASAPPAAAPHGSASILIVDDDPIQLRTARRVLNHLGYRVEAVNGGDAAIDLFERAREAGGSPYDLVIVDMVLNESRDGLQLFEQIRAVFPAQIGMVASGHASTERTERAAADGIAWLSKPYTMDGLARAVQSALAGRPGAGGVRDTGRVPPRRASRRAAGG